MAITVSDIRGAIVLGDYDNGNGTTVNNNTKGLITVGLSKVENDIVFIDEDTVAEIPMGGSHTFVAGLGSNRKVLMEKEPDTTLPTIVIS